MLLILWGLSEFHQNLPDKNLKISNLTPQARAGKGTERFHQNWRGQTQGPRPGWLPMLALLQNLCQQQGTYASQRNLHQETRCPRFV